MAKVALSYGKFAVYSIVAGKSMPGVSAKVKPDPKFAQIAATDRRVAKMVFASVSDLCVSVEGGPSRPRQFTMNILILSRNRFLYSTRRLVKAARMRGHEVTTANPLTATLTFKPGLALAIDGQEIAADVVIPRIGHSITEYGLAVVEQLECRGTPSVNGRDAMELARDKARALLRLTAAGVPTPPTALTRNPDDVEAAVRAVGGLPVILKTLSGTQGIGVMLVDSMASVRSIHDAMRAVGQDVLIQKFIVEASGCDLRAIVVGGRVVAAMRRKSCGDEFRANLHRGARAEAYTLSAEYEAIALKAAAVVNLDVAGVDILETAGGPVVLEVNPAPGLEGIEAATALDVADCIIEHAETIVARHTGREAALPAPVHGLT